MGSDEKDIQGSEEGMIRFGLSFLRKEGCAAHPDDPICGSLSDELYVRQLRAYLAANVERPEDLFLSRPELLARSMEPANG